MQKIVATGRSEFEWEQLVKRNAQQIYVHCPDGIIIREVCPWPKCIFRSLLQFFVEITFKQSLWGKPPPSPTVQA